MKKIIFMILMIVSTATFADSPLTSSEFYSRYSEYPQVNNANERENKTLTDQDIQFLTDDTIPLGARLALINALGYQQQDKGNDGIYLSHIIPNANSYNEALDELDYKKSAEETIIFAYLLAMNNYSDVAIPFEMAKSATEKNPHSLAIRIIFGLIHAQIELDRDWCQVYHAVDYARTIPDLDQDMKPEAVTQIFEDYIDQYKENCPAE